MPLSAGTGPCPIVHGNDRYPVDAVQGSPVASDSGGGVPLYSGEFAADPDRFYRDLRARFGPVVSVELAPGVPAMLVLGYEAALRILRDAEHFPADPRTWQRGVPVDCPMLPALAARSDALRTVGAEHARYRRATVDALARVDRHGLQAMVERSAVTLINSFCGRGEVDLRAEYVFPLVFDVLHRLVGICPRGGEQVFAGMSMILDAVDARAAAEGQAMVDSALGEVVAAKRAAPGADVASWLLADPAALTEEEVVAQIALLYSAGAEPTATLVLSTLRLTLTDEQFAAQLLGGAAGTVDGIEESLFVDPPQANFCVRWPVGPRLVERVWLPAHRPVLIGLAACNTDPKIRGGRDPLGGGQIGNRSHLSWGAGTHACPARDIARIIATVAIDQLLDVVPDIRLAVPADRLTWRQGPLHRALAALPVVFPPAQPLHP